MDYKNRLKGAITQVLLKSLLEDAGYRIVPLGIEEVLRELACLDKDRYNRLNLPAQLRKLPDFFVADTDFNETFLVEVKYRKQWNDSTRGELQKTLDNQVRLWSPLILIIFLGETAKSRYDTPQPSHLIKAATLKNDGGCLYFFATDHRTSQPIGWELWEKASWDKLTRIQDIFSRVSSQAKDKTITKSASILESLRSLDNLFE